jgi:hypothetical protein
MKNNNTFLFFRIVLFLFLPAIAFSQSFWSNSSVTAGFAVSSQDRRMFDFALAKEVLGREDSKWDYEYNLTWQKRIISINHFSISTGIGYSAYNTYFSRPFDYIYLSGIPTKQLRFIQKYTIHKLIFPISNKLHLSGDHNLFLKFDILPQAAFRKSVIDIERFTKRKFEWYSLSLYPGIGLNISSHLQVAAHCRLIHIQKLDEIIFNSILFHERNPEFLRKKYDDYNPFQLWFTVSYLLGKEENE